jgi:Cu-Zn family superoxide dismutase
MTTALLTLLACAAKVAPTPTPTTAPASPPAPALSATLESRSGSTVTGTVTLTEVSASRREGDEVSPAVLRVEIRLAGATPGDHAVHVHATGDCSAPDASSAGPHFNPENHAHGDHASAEKHPGDFGNVSVAADGTGQKTIEITSLTLTEGPLAARDHAVIVHEKADDFGQPTGNAGGRQACGVLR